MAFYIFYILSKAVIQKQMYRIETLSFAAIVVFTIEKTVNILKLSLNKNCRPYVHNITFFAVTAK